VVIDPHGTMSRGGGVQGPQPQPLCTPGGGGAVALFVILSHLHLQAPIVSFTHLLTHADLLLLLQVFLHTLGSRPPSCNTG
jgi:hypothetical protein